MNPTIDDEDLDTFDLPTEGFVPEVPDSKIDHLLLDYAPHSQSLYRFRVHVERIKTGSLEVITVKATDPIHAKAIVAGFEGLDVLGNEPGEIVLDGKLNLTREEACEYLRCESSRLATREARGELTAARAKVDGRPLYNVARLEKLLFGEPAPD